jgi:MFS family permease
VIDPCRGYRRDPLTFRRIVMTEPDTTTVGSRRSRDFRSLWFGESVSLLGDQVATLALPTAAVISLGASATEVGGLNAVGTIAYPVLGLFAGALMDRVRRTPLMIAANAVRMACFVVLVACAAAGWVSLPLLYVVAGVVGAPGTAYPSHRRHRGRDPPGLG